MIMGEDLLNTIFKEGLRGSGWIYVCKWNPAIVRFAEIQKGNKKIQQVLMIKKVHTLALFIYLHVTIDILISDCDFTDWKVLQGLKLLRILFTSPKS